MSTSDEDLYRASPWDASAVFGELFDRHADAVYRYCFRRTGSWSDAEDLTSITFLEGWRSRANARFQQGSLLPWLLGVATNVDRNRARAKRRYRHLLSRLPAPADVPDISDASAAKVDAEAVVRSVLAELAKMSAGDRDVAILCLGQGLTYAEAAAALDIPIGTVRSRVSRARLRLSAAAQESLGRPPLERT